MEQPMRRILVTGAKGFIGQNLCVRLGEQPQFSVVPFVRGENSDALPELVAGVDAIIHLAGENRPSDEAAFQRVNVGLTEAVCDAIRREIAATGRRIPLIMASSTQAESDTAYGRSKLAAEKAGTALAEDTGNPVVVFRLPGVFGKWCRPNYNSVVATFCHNIARGLPIHIGDPDATLRIAYIDDVVAAMMLALSDPAPGVAAGVVAPEYSITVGELADQITAFEAGRETLRVESVGTGLLRALYSTYVSALPVDRFSYQVPRHADSRGVFVEMLKTPNCGQFSFLTAPPGVTRGGHYHHTKTEKFLVIRGEALFRFRHLLTDQCVDLQTSGASPQIVETIPGWAHDITNVGGEEMIVMLWANEIFDRNSPDTITASVKS